MWHEARRQERKIRGIMVDFKRRADRRKEFYEKIKQDPTQFLRMYGRPAKIHLDPAVATAAEGPQSMMPWQGDNTNMIDRFDVRANLDIIPPYTPDRNTQSDLVEEEERFSNYERYRSLVENEAAGLSEEQCLHQIYLDEHFGTLTRSNDEEKKKNADKKAAIGFVYEDSTPVNKEENEEDKEEEESDEDIETADLDITIDIDALTPDQTRELNLCATHYGMRADDFSRLLKKDKEELEMLKEARQLEEAKAQFSGRKSRRERRAINEKRQNPQRFSRPSYAARESPKYEPYKRPGSTSPRDSMSRSRSRSSEPAPVTFITSFGADSDEEAVVQGPALPTSLKTSAQRDKPSTKSSKCETSWKNSGSSGARSERGGQGKAVRQGRTCRSSSRSQSRSRSRQRSRSRSHHRSRTRSHGRSRSRSRSRSRQLRHRSSKSSSRSVSVSKSRSKTRSRSRSHSRRRARLSGRRTRSGSSSRSRSRSKSRSRSRSQNQPGPRSVSPVKKPVVKRYRRESLSSSSGLSGMDSDDDLKRDNSSSSRSSPPRTGTSVTKSDLTTSGKIDSKPLQSQHTVSLSFKENPKERLKRRMQAQLNRQFKADKKAEITKISKQEQERLDREEEIRSMAMEIRRREREKRHKEREEEEKTSRRSDSDSNDSDDDRQRRRRGSSPTRRSRSPVERRDRLSRKEERRDSRGIGRSQRDEHSSSREDRKRSPQRIRPLTEIKVSRPEDREPRGGRWGGGDVRDSGRRNRDMTGRSSGRDGRAEEWSRQRYGAWDDGPGEWGDRPPNWGRRPPPPGSTGYNSNGRPRQPLLQRPGSPLMARPRPPNDPSLMEG